MNASRLMIAKGTMRGSNDFPPDDCEGDNERSLQNFYGTSLGTSSHPEMLLNARASKDSNYVPILAIIDNVITTCLDEFFRYV